MHHYKMGNIWLKNAASKKALEIAVDHKLNRWLGLNWSAVSTHITLHAFTCFTQLQAGEWLADLVLAGHVLGDGKRMAYRKVSGAQRAQYLDHDDLQATSLELEWDMEKELEEPGFDHFQLDGAVHQAMGSTQRTDLDLEPVQPSASPKGRFQRLQEDPDYISHYTRPPPKSNRCSFCWIFKLFCTAMCLFIIGILIGHYGHAQCPPSPTPSEPSDPHFSQEILKELKAEDLAQIFSADSNSNNNDEGSCARVEMDIDEFEMHIPVLFALHMENFEHVGKVSSS
ncbi:Inactive N-acetylated-alpha-linked acidic dipeptidase-like protein 2 [Varanus komodoensis]|nr:Inactive N-acetylated-alpha-linked acidic dipeptidase-like protein 2 [Varanus komodoensis]